MTILGLSETTFGLLLILVACLVMLKKVGLFQVAYSIYTSPVGKIVHRRMLNQSAGMPHSLSSRYENGGMRVISVPILGDNYSYLVVDQGTNKAFVVDPADASAIQEAVSKEKVDLTTILTTHKHWDHAGGNKDLKAAMPALEVIGSAEDAVDAMTRAVGDGDVFQVGNMSIKVLSAPCHTRGHVLFVVSPPDSAIPCLFSGDTLFVGGVGKFFEGTGGEMLANMQKIARLPKTTKVFPGHEYTTSNLAFALSIDNANTKLQDKNTWAHECRAADKPTVPSTVEDELAYNPFMRAETAAMAKVTGLQDPVAVMQELRRLKDQFKANL